MKNILLLFAAGAAGALAKELIDDNTISLPKISNGKLFLGVFGSMIIGGFVGYYIDGSYITAAMAGFTGSAVILAMTPTKNPEPTNQQSTVEQQIRTIAIENAVDPDLAIRVAKCESNLNTLAVHINTEGSKDRGLYQWNNKYHPEITDEIAFDLKLSTEAFCKAVKNGKIEWWNASKKCWDLPAGS